MLKHIEKMFVVAMLFYSTRAILPFILGNTGDIAREEGNPLAFAVQTAFYLVAFSFIARQWRTVLRGAWNAKWILLLAFVALISTVWSQHPLLTLRRSAVMLGTTAFGIYFGSRFTVPQQLRLVGCACALIVFTSFFMAIFLPHYGIDHDRCVGTWRGAFTHKNTLAGAMVLSVLVFYFARPPAYRWVRWLGITGALCLLVLSHSATGVVVFTIMVLIHPLYRLVHSKLTVAIPISIVVGIAAVGSGFLLCAILPSLLGVLQRDPTLTGRTELWRAILLVIARRPWLGYGFNAFWMTDGASATVVQHVDWFVMGGHNGFLDVTIDLGILGLSILVAGYVVLWRRALHLARKTTGVIPTWLCTYLAFIFFSNLTESTILHQNNIFWILYTATAVSISLQTSASADRRRYSPSEAILPELPAVAG
ncbi:MAG: O-antigen ligase family protein [Terriglobia bacterium]